MLLFFCLTPFAIIYLVGTTGTATHYYALRPASGVADEEDDERGGWLGSGFHEIQYKICRCETIVKIS